MSKIAISYRRSDAGFVAGILYDRLTARYVPIYGKNAVYMDVRDIRSGEDYEREFGGALRDCDVMLAVMGPNWFGGAKPGHTKISDPDDPVRQELELATQLTIRILPVLVEGAEMIKETKLPQKLKYLAKLNAEEVRSGRHQDTYIEHLCRTVDGMLGVTQKPNAGILRRWFREIGAWFARPIPIAALILATVAAAFAAWQYSTPRVLVAGPPSWIGKWPWSQIERAGDDGGPSEPVAVAPLQLDDAAALRSFAFGRGNVAVAGDDGIIRFWNAKTFAFEKSISVLQPGAAPRPRPSVVTPRPHAVHKIAFSKLGDALYSVGLDDKVRVIDPATGLEMQTLRAEPGSQVSLFHSLAAFPGTGDASGRMRFVAAGADDGCFRIWDIDEQDESKKLPWRRFAGGNGDVFFAECQSAPKMEQREVEAIAYSPEARDFYVVANFDGTLGFVNGRFDTQAIRAHDNPIWDVVFSPTGDRVASAGGDGAIKIWDFSKRTLIKESPKLGFPVWSLAWDGELLVSGDPRSVRLWNAATGSPQGEPFAGHKKNVIAVAFHPTRKWIVSAAEDGMLKVWERDRASEGALLTIIAYKKDQYIIIHRDSTFTGPSSDVMRYVEMRYADGPKKGQTLPDEEKKKRYRTPDVFVQKMLMEHPGS